MTLHNSLEDIQEARAILVIKEDRSFLDTSVHEMPQRCVLRSGFSRHDEVNYRIFLLAERQSSGRVREGRISLLPQGNNRQSRRAFAFAAAGFRVSRPQFD